MPGLLPFDTAMANMLDAITPITGSEFIELTDLLDRVLAKDINSPMNVPPHNNSAMDGYAFKHENLLQNKSLTMVGRSMAGAPYEGECQLGQCIRIMTGAKLPSDCDTVEMQENCDAQSDQIQFLSERKLGDNVRYAGEDIAVEQCVFKRGRKLTAADIGVLASLGVAKVEVYRQLTIALLSTGDELKMPGESLNVGDIYESNSHFLLNMLKRLNVKVINLGIIEDDKQAILAAFKHADEVADAVISSGGVSVGDADYTKEVLDELGEIDFWKIAMKPGKPFAFGTLPNSYFFGLPGNPVSALVTAHQLTVPALLKLQNSSVEKPIIIKAKSTVNLKKSPGRMDFQRGVLSTNESGEMIVATTGSQGSGILTSISSANCYIVLASCQGKVAKDEWVDVQLFDKYLQ
jgi:molybdopterin molybdotransferase